VSIILRRATLGIAVLSLIDFSPAARAAEGEGWDWMVAPYLWAASIGTDVRAEAPPADSETEFSDLIDKLDGAFLLRLEGQGDRFGVFADLVFLGVAGDNDHPLSHSESDLDTWLIEAAGVWSPGDDRSRGVDLFAGLRYVDVDLTVQVDPLNPLFDTATIETDKNYSDLMIGARYTWALSERWRLTLRGDGSVGDTEGTWSASAIAQYRTRNGGWLFGYRHLSVEIETGDSNTEITMSGPAIGYGFSFL
jgi:hypothetical protein